MSFAHNSAGENFLLRACRCWYDRLSLRETDQKYNFGGVIGRSVSNSDFFFCHVKVTGLHAKHDAAGAVRQQSGKAAGYCYIIGGDKFLCACSRDFTTLFPS